MDLTLAVAQGFHNAPRLYGDTTVRRPVRITGIRSGLKAAGGEFIFGIYDGVSGLVVQPYKGARDGGPVGFVKGIGMGLTGFLVKDLAAVIGPFGYTMKGVHKQATRYKQPTHFIRKARIIQGQRDLTNSTEEQRRRDRETVYHGWDVVQEVRRMLDRSGAQGLTGRIKAMKERKDWSSNEAFENVEMAEEALAARKKGQTLREVFKEQRVRLEQAERAEKNKETKETKDKEKATEKSDVEKRDEWMKDGEKKLVNSDEDARENPRAGK
jgi:hypothetical protein